MGINTNDAYTPSKTLPYMETIIFVCNLGMQETPIIKRFNIKGKLLDSVGM